MRDQHHPRNKMVDNCFFGGSMKNFSVVVAIVVLMCLLGSMSLSSGNITNLSVYYPTWCMRPLDDDGYGLPPWDIKWDGITHIVVFMDGNVQTTSPYYGPRVNNSAGRADSLEFQYGVAGAGNGSRYGDSLISIAHRNGVKILLTIQAVDAAELNFVAQDSTRSEVFARAAAGFAKNYGADGLELNWEDWITPITSAVNVNRLVRILRRRMNDAWYPERPVLFTSASRLDAGLYWASQDSAIDMHNLQCYNFQQAWDPSAGSNRTWFQTPLLRGTDWQAQYPNLQCNALTYNFETMPQTVIDTWANLGHPRSKLGVGFGVYGYINIGNDGPMQVQQNVFQDLQTWEMLALTNYGGQYVYDTQRESPYIKGTATGNPPFWWLSNGQKFYALFEDSVSLYKKIRWIDSSGAGGIMLYDFKGTMRPGADFNHRNPEVQWAAHAIASNVPPGYPIASTFPGSSITQTSATLNGNVNAGGFPTIVRFIWGTSSGVYTDSALAVESPVNGSTGSSVSSQIVGLNPSTAYFFRARAYNLNGNSQGAEVSFATNSLPTAPTVTSVAASAVGQSSAQLNGVVNPGSSSTTVKFVWGVLSGVYTDTTFATQSPINGGQDTPVSKLISGLTPSTTYFYRVTAVNSIGTVQSSEVSFMTQLPGGQGLQDVSSQGSTVALITNPTGAGNHDIEIIRDGLTPPLGSGNALEQYDTFTGGAPRSIDWIGYQFTSDKTFSRVVYQEGLDNQWGGCFTNLGVEVNVGGVWTSVSNLTFSPSYPGSNFVNYETFEINFDPITGDGIRIIGSPTGSAQYIGVGELRVFANGTTGNGGGESYVPKDFKLQQNYPNPFNPETTIKYFLPEKSHVDLSVYNLLGEKVATLANGVQPAGASPAITFSANGLPAGIYIYRLIANNFTEVKKMVLLK